MQKIPVKYLFGTTLLHLAILYMLLIFVSCAIQHPKSAHTIRKPPQLHILSYNIRTGLGMDGQRDLNRIAKIIREVRPDIVVLQEVDNGTRRAGGLNQARVLQRDTLPLPGEPRVAGALGVMWPCASAAETLWVIGTHLDTEPRPRRQSVVLLHQWIQQFGSAPADSPRVQIDYVLYRPANAWKVIRQDVLNEPVASDHRPLLVVLRYQGICP